MSIRRLARASLAAVMISAGAAAFTLPSPAQAVLMPVAVDVDIVEGGVWVTYSDGCIEERAWRQPFGVDVVGWHIDGDSSCAGDWRLADRNYEFFRPHVIRAPLVLGVGQRVVALVPVGDGEGYWLVTSAGQVVTGGAAQHLGDLSAFTLNAPVVAAAPTESGDGYYMLSADGGVFSFGDARFYGSVQGLVDEHVGVGKLAVDHITAPVVTLATTSAGYWLVAADGAVFPFGDAAYHGSIQDSINTGNQLSGVTRDWVLTPPVTAGALLARDALSEPVIGVVPSGGGAGYQMVAADGGIFNFGVSQFHGSLAGRARSPAVASDVTGSRSGYVILTEGGTVHRFGVMDGEWDPVGRAPTALTPTALPANECRPNGEQGFPLSWDSRQPTGSLDVGVVFVEFDDHPVDRERWPLKPVPGPNRYNTAGYEKTRDNGPSSLDVQTQLEITEDYLEAMSYGNVNVEFIPAPDWISVGPLKDEYWDSRRQGTVLGSEALLDHVLSVTSNRFDFTNRGLGYDIVAMVFSVSGVNFGQVWSEGWTTPEGATIDRIVTLELPVREQVRVTITPGSPAKEHRKTFVHQFWQTFARSLMQALGLDLLIAGDASLYGGRFETGYPTWFGLMGVQDYWPTPAHWRSRAGGTAVFRDGTTKEVDSFERDDHPFEMVTWLRWRLGWLDADHVLCLSPGHSVFDLGPLSALGAEPVMAVVPLSNSRFMVLEHRTRSGWDADFESDFRSGRADNGHEYHVDGDRWYYKRLNSEGVLPYVVDTTQWRRPIRMFADDTLEPGEDWTLGPGESRSGVLADGTALRLDVSEGPNGTARVEISTS